MDEQNFTFSGSFRKTREYVDTQLQLLKLRTIAKTSKVISGLILDVVSLLICVLIVFFVSLALGFFLGKLMGSIALGFLTTGVLFLFVLLILKGSRAKLQEKLINKIVAQLLSICDEDFDIPVKGRKSNADNGFKDGENENQ